MNKFVLLGVLFLAAGCTVKPPIEGRADPFVPTQIHLDSDDMRYKTAFDAPMYERRNGILFVTVPVRSTINKDLHVDYRVSFFDEAGRPSEPTSGWMTETLPSNIPSYVQFNSTNANAARFQLDVRWSQI